MRTPKATKISDFQQMKQKKEKGKREQKVDRRRFSEFSLKSTGNISYSYVVIGEEVALVPEDIISFKDSLVGCFATQNIGNSDNLHPTESAGC